MKKKLLTAVLSMALCLGMGVTALAAPSPTTSTEFSGPTATASSYEADLNSAYTSSAGRAAATELYQAQVNGTVNSYIENVASTQAGMKNATYVWSGWYDVVPGVETLIPVKIPYGATVLHLKHDGSWEVVYGVRYVSGGFTVTLNESSGFAVVNPHYHYWQETIVYPTATSWGYTLHTCVCGESYADNYIAPGGSATVAAAGGAAVTSPKTAESGLPMALLFVAVAAAGGAAMYARRRIHM